MGFELADQTVYFLFSLLFGAVLSAIYDVIRILRFAGINKPVHIIVTDILYFVFCALLTFLYALPFNNGGVRYFVLFGEAVGFVVYRFTVGEVNSRIYKLIIAFFSKIIEKTLKYTRVFLNKLLKANTFVVYNVGVLIHKIQNIVVRKKDNI